MDNIVTNIKERVLELANYKGVVLEKFFSDLGVTYGSFKGQNKSSSLNSSVIERIHELYPDVNLSWLISGKGEMIDKGASGDRKSIILGDSNVVSQDYTAIGSIQASSAEVLSHKEELIAELRRHIEDLKEELKRKDAIISHFINMQSLGHSKV